MNPGSGTLRIARGGVLAAACLILAVASHLGGGGHLPPMPGLLVTGALLGAAFAVLAGKQRGPLHLVAASTGAQLLFHVAFTLEGHDGHAALVSGGPRMLATHAAATIAVAMLADRADSLLWSLTGLLDVVSPPSLAVVPALALPPSLPLVARPVLPRPPRHG